jgi:hypothetical protein
LREAVDLHAEIGAAAGEAHSLQRLAELGVRQGDRAEARRLLQRALPLARWSPIAMHLLQRIHGTMIVAADTPQEARAAVERAEATVGPEDHCYFCQIMVSVPAAIACAGVGDVEPRGSTCRPPSGRPRSGRARHGRRRSWRPGRTLRTPRVTSRAATGCWVGAGRGVLRDRGAAAGRRAVRRPPKPQGGDRVLLMS